MGSGMGRELRKAAYGGENVRAATPEEQAGQAKVEARLQDRYQGVVIVIDGKPHFRGDYKAVYYCPEAVEEFRRDVRDKKTELGELVQDSRWLPNPASWKDITAIGDEMLKGMWGTR